MYNGIGLATARGSGTNGYVQRNQSHLRPKNKIASEGSSLVSFSQRSADASILLHERRRAVEVKCAQLKESLLASGRLNEDEVVKQVDQLRKDLILKVNKDNWLYSCLNDGSMYLMLRSYHTDQILYSIIFLYFKLLNCTSMFLSHSY